MDYKLEPASLKDREAILQVMEPWNMHHVPSPEMEELDLKNFFVAKINGKIIGASGYKILTEELAETTLLGIYPEFQGYGLGKALQNIRLEAMHAIGIKKLLLILIVRRLCYGIKNIMVIERLEYQRKNVSLA